MRAQERPEGLTPSPSIVQPSSPALDIIVGIGFDIRARCTKVLRMPNFLIYHHSLKFAIQVLEFETLECSTRLDTQ